MTQINPRSQTFKTRDASSYDSVTDEFDRFTDRLSPPLAAQMIYLAQLAPSNWVLDVGTGTGHVALQAAQEVGPNGKVLGIDLSDGMLDTARAKALRAGLTNCVEFLKMDAEALELEDCTFDVVLSLFALLHFPNPLTALEEMFRVLSHRGKLVLAVGSGPPTLSLTDFVHRVRRLSKILLKLQGKQLTAPGFLNSLVEKYFPESDEPEETLLARESLNRTRSVLALVRRAGFAKVRSYWEGHQASLETPEEYWDLQRTFSSIARKRLSSAPLEKVNALQEEFLETCRKVQSRGGRLVYPFAVFYVTAQRPPA